MFWTDKSTGEFVIKKAPMDGSGEEIFVPSSNKMKSLTDIVIDMTGKILFSFVIFLYYALK